MISMTFFALRPRTMTVPWVVAVLIPSNRGNGELKEVSERMGQLVEFLGRKTCF